MATEQFDPAKVSESAQETTSSESLTQEPRVFVVVSDDKMLAQLFPDCDQGQELTVSLDEISQAMKEAKLPVPPPEQLQAILGGAETVKISGPIILARGTPPVDDVPGRLQLLAEQPQEQTNGNINHYERHRFVTAAADQPIAVVIKRVPGHDGADVFGKPIPAKHPRDEQFSLGSNVGLDADGCTVKSKIAGRVRFERGKLWVEPLLDIPGDVDFSVGNINFCGDVHIRGNVLDLFRVKSSGSVSVDGTIEAAEVCADQNLLVRGGIVGKEKGRCVAGGDVSFKYATNASITAGGNVHAQVEIASSNVTCGGVLDIPKGTIIGGKIHARGGVRCATAGSPSGTKTLIEVGTDPGFQAKAAEQLPVLRELQKKAKTIRETAAPFVSQIKHLSPQQREKVTEILFQAEEAEEKVKQIISSLRDTYNATHAACKQDVQILHLIYPGVTVRFADVECTIEQPLQGPLQLIPRHTENGLAVFAVDPKGGQGFPLPSHALADDAMRAIVRAVRALG